MLSLSQEGSFDRGGRFIQGGFWPGGKKRGQLTGGHLTV